ncbi:hypothetical protein BDF19DRAFT_420694 [Syncephalis fuscata]|nr:hypothetical protein BDF19DRAFT_420694 [Syncephalis fuscata]
MKLSIAVVCTIAVALVASTSMVDAKPALVRRGAPFDIILDVLFAYGSTGFGLCYRTSLTLEDT